MEEHTKTQVGNITGLLMVLVINSIPLYGIFFEEWTVIMTLAFFWVESGLFIFFNSLKVLFMQRQIPSPLKRWGMAFGLGAFYLCFIGFQFLLVTFVYDHVHHETSLTEQLLSREMIYEELMPLFVLEGILFVREFVAPKKYQEIQVDQVQRGPILRLFTQQLAVIFGLVGAAQRGDFMPVLLILILIKTLSELGIELMGLYGVPFDRVGKSLQELEDQEREVYEKE